MSPEDQVRRGQRAALILNDELFKEGIKALRDRAVESFRNANPADLEALRVARIEYEVTERLVNAFTGFMTDGRLAALRIEARQQAPKGRSRTSQSA